MTQADIEEMFGEPESFEPFAFYSSAGDLVECFFTSEPYYGEWINPHLTIYRSDETDEIIGFVIENAKRFCSSSATKAVK